MDKLILKARQDMNLFAQGFSAIGEANFIRVLEAFRSERVSAQHFATTTGYGYNDLGRDKLEALYARVFHGEAALVRQNIVSGSHAIALALAGNLLPGDELLCLGMPYDTLQTVMGLKRPVPGSLRESGISCRVYDLDFTTPDLNGILAALRPETKMVAVQRSRGYSSRPSLSIAKLAAIAQALKAARPELIVFVDNCYGEFVEPSEPTDWHVDLMAGSLIKNPGAGLAPGGGYIVGKEAYVERAAYRLTIPGAGRELGAALTDQRPFYQALFLAPQVVQEALLCAVFTASICQSLGFAVSPEPDEARTDIIQTIDMGNPERLIAFCRGIQKYSPVDSFVEPLPWPMPGYDNDIVMAAGGFVAGSSIELSADAPLRAPYTVYFQGGLNHWHGIYAVSSTLKEMRDKALL